MPVADNCAAPTAIGVQAFGRPHVLGVSIKVSEAEIHRRAFLESLVARGLQGAIAGIEEAAERAITPSACTLCRRGWTKWICYS